MPLTPSKISWKWEDTYRNLSIEGRERFLATLSPTQLRYFRYFTSLHLRQEQLMPDDWSGRYYIAQCGRGWGKNKMGAFAIKQRVYKQQKGLAIVAASFNDLDSNIVPAICDEFPPDQKPEYIGGNKSKIVCHNGITIPCFTSEQEIRGGNYSFIWCDEFCKWCKSLPEKALQNFKILDFALRKGEAQFLITTTPKSWPIFFNWKQRFEAGDPNVRIIRGSMFDNDYLPQAVRDNFLREYGGSREGKQELYGDLLSDLEGALFNWDMITPNRFPSDPLETQQGRNLPLFPKDANEYIRFIVIAVDPAGEKTSDSDETGLVVVGFSNKGHAYVLEDRSDKYTPNELATRVKRLYDTYHASAIVVEKNYGGAFISATLRTVDPHLPIKEVSATRGKVIRATPIVSRYEQGMVHHVSAFDTIFPKPDGLVALQKLEMQMCSFTGDPSSKSQKDDRVDALIWALSYFFVEPIMQNRDIRHLPNFM